MQAHPTPKELLWRLHEYSDLKELLEKAEKHRIVHHQIKKQLFNQLVGIIPEVKVAKKQLAEQVETVFNLLQNQAVYKKVGAFFKHCQELSSVLRVELAQDKQTPEAQTKSKTVRKIYKGDTKERVPIQQNQVYVRLIPKGPAVIEYMVKAKNFPRLEVKLFVKQSLQHLMSYLKKKWLKNSINRLVLYPDIAKDPKKEVEPLNNFLMVSDILCCHKWPEPNTITLLYDIKEGFLEPKITKAEQQKQLDIVRPDRFEKKEESKFTFDHLRLPENSFGFNNNSFRMDQNSALFGIYNSLDFQSHRPDMLFGNNSMSQFNREEYNNSNNNNLEAIRQSIQMVETEVRVQEDNSFKQVRKADQVIIIPSVKRKSKL